MTPAFRGFTKLAAQVPHSPSKVGWLVPCFPHFLGGVDQRTTAGGQEGWLVGRVLYALCGRRDLSRQLSKTAERKVHRKGVVDRNKGYALSSSARQAASNQDHFNLEGS